MTVREGALTSEPTSPARMFWIFWGAQATSSVGTAVTAVALPLLALLTLDVSAWQLGLISGATHLAWLVLGLPAGVIVHRLPLRGSQVAMDLVRAAALLSLPVLWLADALEWWHVLVAALVISAANVIFDVGNSTFLATVVPKQELQRRNSLVSATESTTLLGGPALGGALTSAIGPVYTLLVDVVSYLTSALFLRSLPPRRIDAPSEPTPMVRMVREGWQFVVRHATIGPLAWAAAAANLVCGMHMTLIPLFLVRELDAPAWLVGVLLAADGGGALVGASVTPWLSERWGTARAIVVAGLAGAAGCVVMASGVGTAGPFLFVLGSATFSIGVVVLSITARTNRQVHAPLTMLPRVMATVRFISWSVIPVGAVGAGLVAGVVGVRETLMATGVIALAAPLLVLGSRIGWHRDLDEVLESPVDDVRTLDGGRGI